MTVNVGHLYRKRTVRRLDGSIHELRDDADGGIIIANGKVVNQEKIDELAKIELDRQSAAQAITQAVGVRPDLIEQRIEAPSKSKEIEDRMTALETKLDTKLDAILKAISK